MARRRMLISVTEPTTPETDAPSHARASKPIRSHVVMPLTPVVAGLLEPGIPR